MALSLFLIALSPFAQAIELASITEAQSLVSTDNTDYFYLPNGQKIQLRRKSKKQQNYASQSVQNSALSRSASLVEVNTGSTESALFASDGSSSDWEILPEILVHFNYPSAAAAVLAELNQQFGILPKRKLLYSNTDYVLHFGSNPVDYSLLFEATRFLNETSTVGWAEPNMKPTLERQSIPNDSYFPQQWSLESNDVNDGLCHADTQTVPAFSFIEEQSPSMQPVIAIIDDGVLLNHTDIKNQLWKNAGELVVANNRDDDNNRCVDDLNGCDFGHFDDIDPSPNSEIRIYGTSDHLANSFQPEPQSVTDTHGTGIAGLAAATRNNRVGISGSAYNAQILPIRINFATSNSNLDCSSLIDALSYAARYADVISNSWRVSGADQFVDYTTCKIAMDSKLTDIANGDSPLQKRSQGTPVLFASGNAAAGWRKITINNIPGGQINNIKWVFYKDSSIESVGEDAVWIDNIKLPDQPLIDFNETSALPQNFTYSTGNAVSTGLSYQSCAGGSFSGGAVVSATNQHTIGGTGRSFRLTTDPGKCAQLETTQRMEEGGSLSFWVWASAEPFAEIDTNSSGTNDTLQGDPFMVFVNGVAISTKLTDQIAEGLSEQYLYHNTIDYPASHPDTIAVGASDTGSLGYEGRAYFSQYGSDLDILAPGVNLVTTNKFNSYSNISGTSAATGLVAGVVANMIALSPSTSAQTIRSHLRSSADKIGVDTGEYDYTAGFNKYFGYGRLNGLNAVRSTLNYELITEPSGVCTTNPDEDDFWIIMLPAILAAAQNKAPTPVTPTKPTDTGGTTTIHF